MSVLFPLVVIVPFVALVFWHSRKSERIFAERAARQGQKDA